MAIPNAPNVGAGALVHADAISVPYPARTDTMLRIVDWELAVHEAAHAVAAVACGYRIENVRLEPGDSDALGWCALTRDDHEFLGRQLDEPREFQGLGNQSEVERWQRDRNRARELFELRLIVTLAGPLASARLLTATNPGTINPWAISGNDGDKLQSETIADWLSENADSGTDRRDGAGIVDDLVAKITEWLNVEQVWSAIIAVAARLTNHTELNEDDVLVTCAAFSIPTLGKAPSASM